MMTIERCNALEGLNEIVPRTSPQVLVTNRRERPCLTRTCWGCQSNRSCQRGWREKQEQSAGKDRASATITSQQYHRTQAFLEWKCAA